MIIAKTGWTSSDLLNALDKTEIKGFFDLVTLLIGVNNQYQNIDLMVYRKEFSQLLNKAICFTKSAPKQVFVLSIPDWSATPFASNRERRQIKTQLDHFNRVNRLETQLSQAHYFDITTISSQAGMDPTFLSKDELHPSEKMYIRWVDLIFPTAYQTLYQVKEETHGNTLHN